VVAVRHLDGALPLPHLAATRTRRGSQALRSVHDSLEYAVECLANDHACARLRAGGTGLVGVRKHPIGRMLQLVRVPDWRSVRVRTRRAWSSRLLKRHTAGWPASG